MRLTLFAAVFISMFATSAHALSLLCDFKNHSAIGVSDGGGDLGHTYQKDFLESWVPNKQGHILDLDNDVATFYREDFKGKITYKNDKRVKWRYIEKIMNDGKVIHKAVTFKYLYLKAKKIIIVSVDFGSKYIPIENVRGTCKEVG